MDFIEDNKAALDEYVAMSQTAGARSDYVQGGGGNTSVKLSNGLMIIKASGYRLDQVKRLGCWASLDYAMLREFFSNTDPSSLADVEAEGAAVVQDSMRQLPGIPGLRPSVEAGFHSMLDKFVLHTHSVYANLACCSRDGRAMVDKALAKSNIGYCFVPYINPGAALTFAVDKAVREETERMGRRPSTIFMQNHGVIVTEDTADSCLRIHDQINEALANEYGVTAADFPAIELEQTGENEFASRSAWLKERLASGTYDANIMLEDVLYPDQLVFFKESLEYIAADAPQQLACAIRPDGSVTYKCRPSVARTLEQTLCAVIFIRDTLTRTGHVVVPMSGSSKHFIGNWESEKHRKSLA